jgi:hypothetical protein
MMTLSTEAEIYKKACNNCYNSLQEWKQKHDPYTHEYHDIQNIIFQLLRDMALAHDLYYENYLRNQAAEKHDRLLGVLNA